MRNEPVSLQLLWQRCGIPCETIGDEDGEECHRDDETTEGAQARQADDDKVYQRNRPGKEGGRISPVRHWEVPLPEPPESDEERQTGEADGGSPKGDALNCGPQG